MLAIPFELQFSVHNFYHRICRSCLSNDSIMLSDVMSKGFPNSNCVTTSFVSSVGMEGVGASNSYPLKSTFKYLTIYSPY